MLTMHEIYFFKSYFGVKPWHNMPVTEIYYALKVIVQARGYIPGVLDEYSSM